MVTTGRIVCGVDRSEEACAAARIAGALARRLGLRLELLHVCRPNHRPDAGVVTAVQRVVREQLRLEDVAVLVEAGSVPDLLAEAARDADMLVVGTRGEHALRQALLGSVAAKLTRAPSHPVVVVPPDAARRAGFPPLHGRTVVCGLRDRRDVATARAAARLATGLGLALTLVHVPPPRRTPAMTGGAGVPVAIPAPTESPERVVDEIRDTLARVLPHPPAVRVDDGLPGPTLSRAAAAESAALIAVGASDRGPLAGALAAAASRHLLRHADRPVLVGPRGESDEP